MAGTSERARDAELLAGLRFRRRRLVFGLLAVLAAAVAAGYLLLGQPDRAVLWELAVLGWGWTWWAGLGPCLRAITEDALLVRQGVRTRTVAREEVADVQPRYGAGYGVVVTLRDAEPVRLVGTATRFSVAAAQAGALRRWAGLEP